MKISSTEDLVMASDKVIKFLKEDKKLSSADRYSILFLAKQMASNEYKNEALKLEKKR